MIQTSDSARTFIRVIFLGWFLVPMANIFTLRWVRSLIRPDRSPEIPATELQFTASPRARSRLSASLLSNHKRWQRGKRLGSLCRRLRREPRFLIRQGWRWFLVV